MTRLDNPRSTVETSEAEWLESDGFGGFASGTVGGERTRRYHALLLNATRPPTGRIVLVNGMEAWLESANGGRYPLTKQRYMSSIVYPEATAELLDFDTAPWPTWRFRIDEQSIVIAETFVARFSGETVLRWRLENRKPRADALMLKVRLLISGRDYHLLHHENTAFDFTSRVAGTTVRWHPYRELPAISAQTNGAYTHAPDWYRNFCYVREGERGLDCSEDLATPGIFSFDLTRGAAVMVLSAHGDQNVDAVEHSVQLAERERERRAAFPGRLQRSADHYIVARGGGRTILAGYPWFTDWGRDTFIAMRGLLLASRLNEDAKSILLEWAETISEGMLPNCFPDDGGPPAYNAVDASLWFPVAVHEYLQSGHALAATRERLQRAVDAILDGYARGTRFNIAADEDGLLHAGVPGVQLTWMDAKVGDWVVTPRVGKPVEVQALWINALRIATAWGACWRDLETRASASFVARFVNPSTGALYDIVDADHVPGRVDAKIRPNQIFAVGGLPHAVLDGAPARAVVEQVEAHLLTPLGLRTLSPTDADYVGRYGGAPHQRDAAYHQGTAWPWLMGPFVEAWVRVQRAAGIPDPVSFEAARARFLAPLYAHLDRAGLDHISEVADGDARHAPGGAPFQAWSLAELLRIERMLGA
jgi:predicted glycogen debranching enzyme